MFSNIGLIFVLAVGTHWISIVSSLETCTGGNDILKYEVGKSYIYEYTSNVNQRNSAVNMTIKAKVILTALSGCEFVLTIEDGSTSSKTGTSGEGTSVSIEKSSLRFIMENGVIVTTFSDMKDSPWTVNIKKAILYMIQNPMFTTNTNVLEQMLQPEGSVFGYCMTTFSQSSNAYSKSVNLQKCEEGEGSDLIFQGERYNLPQSVNKNIVPLEKSLDCGQTLENGIVTKAMCEENHTPYNFIRIQMSSSLQYKSTSDKTITDAEIIKLNQDSGFAYDFTKSNPTPLMEKNAIESVKNLLIQAGKIESNRAEIFVSLKKAISKISDLKQCITIKSDPIITKMFYDAVAEVTTDAGVELLSELALKGNLDTTTLVNFYANMAFASRPGTKALSSLKNLVEQIRAVQPKESSDLKGLKEFEKNTSLAQLLLLGSSGLAHQFCKMTNQSCQDVPEYVALVNAIVKQANVEGSDEILRGALHALGNLDSLTPDAITKIRSILEKDNSAKIWVQILALDSFRRYPFNPDLCQAARKILADKGKPEDVRIHAYLAYVRCGDMIANVVEDKLYSDIFKEENHGVALFIASHTKNLYNSKSPVRKRISSFHYTKIEKAIHETNLTSANEGPRASRFLEYSYFDVEQNHGLSGEAAIMFSPGNKRPQFVSLNGFVDLYGRSFNFLEIGLSQRMSITTKEFNSKDTPADWWSLMTAFAAPDSYYRVFGTTIGIGLSKLHESVQMAVKKVTQGKEGIAAITMDTLLPQTFLDEELTYPSITGLPLSYNLQGVHIQSAKLEMSGLDNIGKIFTNLEGSSKFDVKIKINADSAVDFQGSVGVGANTPVHIGYAVDGKVDHKQNMEFEGIKKEANKLDLKINFPENIISRKTIYGNVYNYEDLNGVVKQFRIQGSPPSPQNDKICSKEGSISGLKTCTKYPHMGTLPFEFECTVEKGNAGMQGYDLQVIYNGKIPEKQSIELIATTPGSDIKREFKAKFQTDVGSVSNGAKWNSQMATLSAEVQNAKYVGQVTFMQTQVLSAMKNRSAMIIPLDSDYSFKVEYSLPGTQLKELINIKTDNSKYRRFEVTSKFDEPLKSVLAGNVNFFMANEKPDIHISQLEITQSGSIKDLKINAEQRMFPNGSFVTDSKVKYGDQTFEVRQRFDSIYKSEQSSLLRYMYYYEYAIFQNDKMLTELSSKFDYQNTDTFRETIMIHYDGSYTKPRTFIFDVQSVKNFDPLNMNATITFDYDSKPIGNANLYVSGPSVKMAAHVVNQFDFSGNSTVENKDFKMKTLTEIIPISLDISTDTRVTDDNNEIVETTKTVVKNKKEAEHIETNAKTILNRKERTLTQTTTTTEKSKIISRFDFFGKLAKDWLNGLSTAKMSLEADSKPVFTASLNETTSYQKLIFTSQADGELNVVDAPKPYYFNWKFISDSNVKDPKSYDQEMHVSSTKSLTGPSLDIGIVKEMSWSKVKGKETYLTTSSTNITSMGELLQHTEGNTEFTVGPEWKNYALTVVGFSQDKSFRNDVNAKLISEGKLETKMITNTTFLVVQTDLTSQPQVRQNLVEGYINETVFFHGFTDFELAEVGRITLKSVNTYNWDHIIRYHAGQWTLA